MRNIKRIKRILKLIEKIWLKHPELRLCQLIENPFTSFVNLYDVEDDEIEYNLKETYNVK